MSLKLKLLKLLYGSAILITFEELKYPEFDVLVDAVIDKKTNTSLENVPLAMYEYVILGSRLFSGDTHAASQIITKTAQARDKITKNEGRLNEAPV